MLKKYSMDPIQVASRDENKTEGIMTRGFPERENLFYFFKIHSLFLLEKDLMLWNHLDVRVSTQRVCWATTFRPRTFMDIVSSVITLATTYRG